MNPPSLELHYHLKQNAHAMDAFIRNKCEAEALAAFSYISERLGIELTIESAAHEEGGLKEIWRFAAKPEVAWSTFITLLTLLVTNMVIVWTAPPQPDKELDAINKEIAKTTLEEKRLAVEKARIELKKLLETGSPAAATPSPAALPPPTSTASPAPSLPAPSKSAGRAGFMISAPVVYTINEEGWPSAAMIEAVEQAIAIIADEPKFTIRRSNFFKTLLPYSKVTAFGLKYESPSHLDNREHVIEKKDFLKYVLKTNKLPPETIDEAVITIVAPVIDGSGMAWKGIYQDAPISFYMKDDAFKEQVLHRAVSFQHGDAIRCSLVIERKLDETGEVEVTNRSVEVVIEKIDQAGGVTETPQGKKRRFEDKNARAQSDLKFGDS